MEATEGHFWWAICAHKLNFSSEIFSEIICVQLDSCGNEVKICPANLESVGQT